MADIREKSDEIIRPIKESMGFIQHRELEQKQELLVGLTNELFYKVEKMSASKEKSKFEFTDIPWYKKN